MTKNPPIAPCEMRRWLRYEPETGRMFWRQVTPEMFADGRKRAERTARIWNTKYAGKEALTSTTPSGHLRGRVRGHAVLSHRVAWALHYGEWPTDLIDHINMNPSDNRIENMRIATKRQNGCNRRAAGKSKYLGVAWVSRIASWKAAISVNNKSIYLGLFKDEVEAAKAYDAGAAKHHGEFARLNFPQTAI
jgi:hypothetical protein